MEIPTEMALASPMLNVGKKEGHHLGHVLEGKLILFS